MKQVMENQSQSKSTLHKTFIPCNTYMLCKKVELPEKIGNIVIPDMDKWEKRFEVVATSPDLISYLDKYQVGDILIYPTGQPTMYINIDGDDFYFLDKRHVVSKI